MEASWQESRPEKVARARRLLKNPAYPGPSTLKAVARLLASRLAGER
jgi:hypothetical protein